MDYRDYFREMDGWIIVKRNGWMNCYYKKFREREQIKDYYCCCCYHIEMDGWMITENKKIFIGLLQDY